MTHTEMEQLEVMKTKTRMFLNSPSKVAEYIEASEREGWAVRRIEMMSHNTKLIQYVVLEDNR